MLLEIDDVKQTRAPKVETPEKVRFLMPYPVVVTNVSTPTTNNDLTP
jgi:hypothetical protein